MGVIIPFMWLISFYKQSTHLTEEPKKYKIKRFGDKKTKKQAVDKKGWQTNMKRLKRLTRRV